jgi:hypothetical protein
MRKICLSFLQCNPTVPISGLCKRLKVVEDGGTEAIIVQETIEPQDVVVALDPYVAVGKKQQLSCKLSKNTPKLLGI